MSCEILLRLFKICTSATEQNKEGCQQHVLQDMDINLF